MFQLPELYSKHLTKQFNHPQYLILLILINLLQNLKTVRLEELARLVKSWLQEKWDWEKTIYLVIDRSQWREINLLMVSLVYRTHLRSKMRSRKMNAE
jgi:hypothetical protein